RPGWRRSTVSARPRERLRWTGGGSGSSITTAPDRGARGAIVGHMGDGFGAAGVDVGLPQPDAVSPPGRPRRGWGGWGGAPRGGGGVGAGWGGLVVGRVGRRVRPPVSRGGGGGVLGRSRAGGGGGVRGGGGGGGFFGAGPAGVPGVWRGARVFRHPVCVRA